MGKYLIEKMQGDKIDQVGQMKEIEEEEYLDIFEQESLLAEE